MPRNLLDVVSNPLELIFFLFITLSRYLSMGESSGEYGGWGKVSYLKFELLQCHPGNMWPRIVIK